MPPRSSIHARGTAARTPLTQLRGRRAAPIGADANGSDASRRANRSTSAGSRACGRRSIGRPPAAATISSVRLRGRPCSRRPSTRGCLRPPATSRRPRCRRPTHRRHCRRRQRYSTPRNAGELRRVSSCRPCSTWTAGRRSSRTSREKAYSSTSFCRYLSLSL